MSLKTFHIFFIAISSLLAFGFGAWCFAQGSSSYAAVGAGSLLSGALLVHYGVKFLERFRHVSFL